MSRPITMELLELYEGVKGELERIPDRGSIDPGTWELLDELVLDLHLIAHGYATESYEHHVERRLKEVCMNEAVIARLRTLNL